MHRCTTIGFRLRRAAPIVLAILTSCSTVNSATQGLMGGGPKRGEPGYVSGFLGGVVADEPRAALAGREVLSAGGTAADAAVAVGLTLAVTLPSRAGLGGGGACLAFSSGSRSINHGVPEAIMFTPAAPANPGPNADRPAAVPMLARGLYLLNARYGNQRFEERIANAEQLARFGVPVSRALAQDLALVAGPLFADPAARDIYSRNGAPLVEGQMLVQPDLASTLSQIRVAGVGDFYQGNLAQRVVDASPRIGGPLTPADLRQALPKLTAPLVRRYRNDRIAFLPPPADGGLGAEAAFNVLAAQPDDTAAATARALAVVARYRAGGVTPEAALDAGALPAAAPTEFPASTTFVTLDRDGDAVACALTLDNLFGTGRIMPGLGYVAAASPAAVTPPLLAAALAWNDNLKAFKAAAGGSGQDGAPVAVAKGMLETVNARRPGRVQVPDPGRLNLIACGDYLPGSNGQCGWVNDPRLSGLALGTN
jgi:gamma-glutamyltranspeptidase / glutathione hydrolase